MFTGKTVDDLLWAVALFFITKQLSKAAKQRGEGGPRPQATPGGITLQSGFYWHFLDGDAEHEAYYKWLRVNRTMVAHRKYLGRSGVKQAVVVFQVLHDRSVKWVTGIPGIPTPAPKGALTTIEDIEGAGSSSVDPDTFSEWFAGLVAAGPEMLRSFDYYMQKKIDAIVMGKEE